MESIWQENKKNKEDNQLKENKKTKVCIIGGGITGIRLAYELYQRKIDFVLLEKNQLASNTTLRTTAKVTAQHGLIYHYLISSYGIDFAKKYFQVQEEAIKAIKETVEKEKIDCHFKEEDSYIGTNDEKQILAIKNEYEAMKQMADPNIAYYENLKFPIESKSAVSLKKQASFHPIEYINGLLDKMDQNQFFENTTVYQIKDSNHQKVVITDAGNIVCDYVVLATKYPIKDIPGFYFLKLYQETSYVIAIKPNDVKKFDGMYLFEDFSKLSFRWIKKNEEDLLLIGGNGHKTGENIPLKEKYQFLEDVAKKIYPNYELVEKWNTEDTISLDKIPYIGEFSVFDDKILVATGYNKWGMTTSHVAAKILADKIDGVKNPYESIFHATRFRPIKNRKELGNMIKTSIGSLIVHKFQAKDKKNVEMRNGTVYKEKGKLVGFYQDSKGKSYKIKPVCKHLGCLVTYNDLDQTWDCPCHGSRYSATGKVIYGPSSKDLDVEE